MKTIIDLFHTSVEKYPENILMWERSPRGYIGTSYRECAREVEILSAGLMALGLRPGECIALISEGRNHWVLSELAILSIGAVCVPLSVKIEEESDLSLRLEHSECRAVIVSTSQLNKILSIRDSLSHLDKIILLEEESPSEEVISIGEIYDLGKNHLEESPDVVRRMKESIEEDGPANICYTSGTTGDPKGIILSHKNYYTNVEQASAILPIPESYASLLILPWDHSFAHTAGVYTLMRNGACFYSVELGSTPIETMKNIPKNIREAAPAFLLTVPSLAKKFRRNIEKGIASRGRLVTWLFHTGLKIAILYNRDGWNRGKGFRFLLRPFYSVFDALVFSKVRASFGGRLEFFIGGGSLLDIHLQRFFYAIGIPIYQGYGLTEASPIISANTPQAHKLGSSGRLVPDLSLKICDEDGVELPIGETGEIVVSGENVMAGYFKNPEATSKTLRDSWLYTGDRGYLDRDGFLYVTGREKSLLIGDDGEKYSPEGIEETLTSKIPYISQVMIYNDQSPYTVALIVPDMESLSDHFKDPSPEDIIDLLSVSLLDFKKENKDFPGRWIPTTFILLREGFTQENTLLNSTMKLVRNRVVSAYREDLDFLYTREGRIPLNSLNIENIKSYLTPPPF